MAPNRPNSGRSTSAKTPKTAKRAGAAGRQQKKAFYLVLALVAIAGIGTMATLMSKAGKGPNVTVVDSTLPPVKSEGYVMGDPSAPLELIEFGDFECPKCAQFSELGEAEFRQNYVKTGKVRLRFIDFPLSMHRNTWNASRAAACADEQGKFWEMHDALYSTQDKWNGQVTNDPDDKIKDIAKERVPGLDRGKFNDCVDSKKMQAKIQAHLKLAEARGLTGTPSFIAGDKVLNGFLRFEDIWGFIDTALVVAAKNPPKPDTTKAAKPDSAKGASKSGK